VNVKGWAAATGVSYATEILTSFYGRRAAGDRAQRAVEAVTGDGPV